MNGPDVPRLVLASGSPRRAELLARLGVPAEVDPAGTEERVLPGELAEDYVVRVAADKAHAVARRRPGAIVVGSDTEVVLDGEVLGTPDGPAHAAELLRRLAGRRHDVLTAVVVVAPDGVEHAELARAEVTMAPVDDDTIDWYVASGEPLDKAGGYGVQGRGAVLVERVDGDPTTVVGLPLGPTLELLRLAGLRWPP